MIATPRPPSTRGRLSLRAYTRSPGLDTRLSPAIERSRVGPNLSEITRFLPTSASCDLPAGDVALLLEDLGDVDLDLGMTAWSRCRGMPSWRCADGSACLRPGRSSSWPDGPPRRGFPAGPAAWSVGAGRAQVGRCGGRGRARLVRSWSPAAGYQLDLVMPGSSPRCAIVRKQIRHRPNLRYTARGRPQREHLVYARTSNFGLRFALAIRLFFATRQLSLNGNPSRRSSERPSSSLVAVVTRVTSMPRCRSTWSGLISWNISCSVRPKV